MEKFTQAYKSYGIHINEDNSVSCKEWAPGAHQVFLTGDFSELCINFIFLIRCELYCHFVIVSFCLGLSCFTF